MRLRSDSGFSLTELLVVMVLMGIILATSFAGMFVARKGSEVAQEQSFFANEIGLPMQVADKMLTQNLAIDDGTIAGTHAPTRYYLSFLTDRDQNNIQERHVFEVLSGANGMGELVYREYRTDAMRQNVALVHEKTFTQTNVNQSQSVPLFTYYSAADRTTITDMTKVPTETRLVDVTIATKWSARPNDPGKILKDNRTITFHRKLLEY